MQKSANVIFDLDGTLVDSASTMCKAGNALLHEINRPSLDVDTYKTFIGGGILRQVEKLLIFTGGIPENNLEKYCYAFQRYYNADPVGSTQPYFGVFQALKQLKDIPVNLAICTQKYEKPARAIMAKFNLLEYFDGFAFGDSLPTLKPSPEMVFHAIRDFRRGSLIYVGDSEVDALTAKNVQAKFLLFAHGYRNSALDKISCHASFENHLEIPRLVKQILIGANT